MNIVQEKKDNMLVLIPDPYIMNSNSTNFREQTRDIISKLNDEETLILNLKNVKMIDSSGLGSIVGLYKALNEIGKKFHVVTNNEDLRQLFSATKLDNVFEVKYES